MPVPISSSNSNVSVGAARVPALGTSATFPIYVRGGFHGAVELSARSLTNRVTQPLEVLPSWDDRCSIAYQFMADPHPLEFLDDLGMCLPCMQSLRATQAGVVLGAVDSRSWIADSLTKQAVYLDDLFPGLMPRGTAISEHGLTVGVLSSEGQQSGFLL